MTIESVLKFLLEGRMRGWTLLIGICAAILTMVLPAVDENRALRHQRTELAVQLFQRRRQLAGQDAARRKAAVKLAELQEWEVRGIPAEGIHQFRKQIVDMARESQCQIRRVRVDAPVSRVWKEEDHPLKRNTSRDDTGDSPHVLQSHRVSLSLSGTLGGVRNMLDRLHAANRFVHCERLSLVPLRENRREAVLDIELLLFDLTEAPAARSGNTS